MIFTKRILFTFFFLSYSIILLAQKLEFGIGGGVSNFKGDVSPNFNPLQIGFGANALFRYNLSRSVSLRAQLLFTSYNASDENTKDPLFIKRGFIVNGNLLEGSLIAEYNFLDKAKMVKKRDWTPYLFGGLGYALVKNKSFINNAPTKFSTPVIPYGLGVKYRFKGPLSICAEFGTRYTTSDEFDVTYGKYLGFTNISEGRGAYDDKLKFGDTTKKDQYYFTSFTLTYTIFDVVCPN